MKSQNVFRRFLAVAAGLASAAVCAGLWAGVPATASETGVVYVVQGLPGRTVDVQVDGRTMATGVVAAKVVGPLTVSSGNHRLTIRSGGSVMLERMLSVKVNGNSDVVVHRPASPQGAPVVTTFENDLSAVPADKGSLTVAHTAAVPPADIKVNGKVLFSNVANGPSILGPADLPVKGGSLTNVYAIGEPKSGTMNVVVHVLGLSHMGSEKPSKVNTGTGGQAYFLGLTW